MRFFLLIFYSQSLILGCTSRHRNESIKKDDLFIENVFQLAGQPRDSVYTEKRHFSFAHRNLKLVHQLNADFSGVADAGFEIKLTINFNDSVLNKSYKIEDLKYDCKMVSTWERHVYDKAEGQIRIIRQTGDELTASFDILIVSKNEKRGLVYKGERTFVKFN